MSEELHFTCIGVYDEDDDAENLALLKKGKFWYHRYGAAGRPLPPWQELSWVGQKWDYENNCWSPPYDPDKWRK